MAKGAESLSDICRQFQNGGATAPGFEFLFAKRLWQEECCSEHETFLLDCCLPKLLSESKRDANATRRIYEITHSLCRLVTILRDEQVVLGRSDQSSIADFVFCFWDFVQDVVCYECVDIFKLLLEMHSKNCEVCRQRNVPCSWISSTATFLCDSSVLNKSRFRCLIAMLKEYSSLYSILTPEFLGTCYNLLANATLTAVLSELLVFDMTVAHPLNRDTFHLEQIRRSIVSDSSLLRSAVNERLLPAMFRLPELASWFLGKVSSIVHIDEQTCDTALEAVLSLARFCLFNQQTLGNTLTWDDFVDLNVVHKAICHSNLLVRLSALNLICDHPKPSLPLKETDFVLLQAFFYFNMSEQSPAARQKMLAHFKKLLIRMRDSGQNLIKIPESEILSVYSRFIQDVHQFLFESLRVDANFNRRYFALCFISHLHCESFLVSKEKSGFHKHIGLEAMLDDQCLAKLILCLEDSYQICQETALKILKHLGGRLEEAWLEQFLESTIENVFSAKMRNDLDGPYKIRFYTHFHPNADTVIFDRLMDEVERRVDTVSASLWEITSESGALHLILNVISSIVESLNFESSKNEEVWRERLLSRLLSLCKRVLAIVTPVVHSMSPEGYAPDDVVEQIGGYSGLESAKKKAFKCQALLVSSWRTHKCISNILHNFVQKLPYPSMLTDEVLDYIGKYYMLQLTECKHVGAFETAVEGFEALCKRLWNIGAKNPLPEQWLLQLLDAIKGGKELEKLCLTRRSAGLPFLVCAILGTEPSSRRSQSLKTTLAALLDVEPLNFDSKIHAVNILKAVFYDNRIREPVLVGVEWAFRICIEGASSRQWPLRNAFSQLFAALSRRVFGIARSPQRSLTVQQKCKLSSFEFFSRFPTLFDFMHEQLSLRLDGQNEFRVFPLLILLSHLFPSSAQMGENRYELATFIPSVWKILVSCKGEKTRELAVASLLSIGENEDILQLTGALKGISTKKMSSNQMNAIVLMLSGVVEAEGKVWIEEILRDITGICENLWNLYNEHRDWPDFNVNLLIHLLSAVGSEELRKRVCEAQLLKWTKKDNDLSSRPLGKLLAPFPELWTKHSICEQLRLEAYRSLVKANQEPCDSILSWAAKDASSSTSPWIWSLLANLADSSLLPVELFSADLKRFDENTVESYIRLYISQIGVVSDEVLCWIRNALIGDDVGLRIRVLRMISAMIGRNDNHSDELNDLLALLLQDEDEVVREEAARVVSKQIDENQLLSSEICWSIVLQRRPALAQLIPAFRGVADSEIESKDTSGTVFDSCARNPFAEAFGCPHVSVVEEVLGL